MKYRNMILAGLAALPLATGIAIAGDAATEAKPKAEAPQKKPAAEPAKCTQAPGSRIRLAQPVDCVSSARGPFRSYSKEDIERTGQTDMAEALRQLDPAFR